MTKLTDGIRTFDEVEAIRIMGILEGAYFEKGRSVDEMEMEYRGKPTYEKAVRLLSQYLESTGR